MKYLIGIVLTGVLFSFYLFPVTLTFFPIANTKMIEAVVGLFICIQYLITKREVQIDRGLFQLMISACLVSVVCISSVLYNNTNDFEYASYIISMLVWLSGAYTVCMVIKTVHGRCDLRLLSNYYIGVCVAQCALTVLIHDSTWFSNVVDRLFAFGQTYAAAGNRLYGIGSALDVAGTRYAAALLIILFTLRNYSQEVKDWELWLLIISLLVILIIGNMVARTTSIGFIIGLSWCIFYTAGELFRNRFRYEVNHRIMGKVAVTLAVVTPLIVNIYHTNEEMKGFLRFGFEGFVSLIEEGHWNVESNNMLKDMIVFPNNTKTWIIGDGYINNPANTDENYVGTVTQGNYYMKTDIGYLRFIFYFGIIGLIVFMFFFASASYLCSINAPSWKPLFQLSLLLNYIIWLKVATDIFVVFALMICASYFNKEKLTT